MIRTSTLAAAFAAAAAVAASTSAPSAAAQSASDDSGVRFTGNHAFRAMNCRGGDAVITGDANQLKLTDCSRLTLTGERNQITVTLSSPGDIVVGGARNAVRYRSPDDGAPNVTDNGRDDDIRPVAG